MPSSAHCYEQWHRPGSSRGVAAMVSAAHDQVQRLSAQLHSRCPDRCARARTVTPSVQPQSLGGTRAAGVPLHLDAVNGRTIQQANTCCSQRLSTSPLLRAKDSSNWKSKNAVIHGFRRNCQSGTRTLEELYGSIARIEPSCDQSILLIAKPYLSGTVLPGGGACFLDAILCIQH